MQFMIQCDLWPGRVVWPHFYRSQQKPITMLLGMMANKHTQDTATNSAECKIRIIPCRQKRSCCLSVTIYIFRAGVIHRQQNNSTCREMKSQRCSFEMYKSRVWQLKGSVKLLGSSLYRKSFSWVAVHWALSATGHLLIVLKVSNIRKLQQRLQENPEIWLWAVYGTLYLIIHSWDKTIREIKVHSHARHLIHLSQLCFKGISVVQCGSHETICWAYTY